MVIADDSVVDDGDSPTVVKVGVRVNICFVAVSSPSRVADCNVVIMF